MGKIIAFISGKGGCGKTTLAANAGVGLSEKGNKVLLLDLDFGMRCLDLPLGMENMIIYHVMDVLDKRCDLQKAVVYNRRYRELVLLAAPLTKSRDDIPADRLVEALEEWKKQFDYILIDCPSGLSPALSVIDRVADRIITVLTPDVGGIRGTDKVLSQLSRYAKDKVALVLNKLSTELQKSNVQLSPEQVSEVLPQPIWGMFPSTAAMYEADCRAELIVTKSNHKLAALYQDFCERLCGQTVLFKDWRKAAKGKFY